nr:hypothetical protein BaRGS_002587 [Batillaria attramentaria]
MKLKGIVFELKQENDTLKRELSVSKKRIEELEMISKEAKFEASTARKSSEALEQYTRRNNIRIFGVTEEDRESSAECERKVLKILKEKLGIKDIKPEDFEAVHRVERSNAQNDSEARKPRPVIARFVSRRSLGAVFKNRKKLKGTGIVIAEDLTGARYSLLMGCRNHPGIENSWTRNGKVFVKDSGSNIYEVDSG